MATARENRLIYEALVEYRCDPNFGPGGELESDGKVLDRLIARLERAGCKAKRPADGAEGMEA